MEIRYTCPVYYLKAVKNPSLTPKDFESISKVTKTQKYIPSNWRFQTQRPKFRAILNRFFELIYRFNTYTKIINRRTHTRDQTFERLSK
jgi:hypothetical protein